MLVHVEVQGQPDAAFPRRMFTLPDDLELQYTDAIFAIEESLKMPYVSYVERRGEARGKVHGAGLLLRDLLEQRFGVIPAEALERLEQADADRLGCSFCASGSTSPSCVFCRAKRHKYHL